MKTRVVEFITSMGEGGAQSIVKDYVQYLDKDQFEVTVFCIFPMLNSGPGQLLKKSGSAVNYVYPRYSFFLSLINKIVGRWVVPYKLRKYIKAHNPDVLHAHLGVLRYMLQIKETLPKRLFFTCHSEPKYAFRKSVEFNAAKELVRTANLQLIALHSQMKEELNTLFGVSNTQVVYNGIDVERFLKVNEDKETIRHSLGIPNDALLIGHVGRFIDAKNHKFIIKVFNEVKSLREDALLLLVGTGPLKEEIKQLATSYSLEKSIIYLEQRNDVDRLLKAMDVFFFPSLYEGLPVSLIEAQAAGLVCVSSDRVTEEAFLTPRLHVLSLNNNLQEWVNALLDLDYKGKYNRNIRSFEMTETIKVLELLYQQF